MRCNVVQRFLLELAHPERPPAAVRAHLEQCAACQTWHKQLVDLERRVPLLSVPNAQASRLAFLQQLRTLASEDHATTTHAPPARRGWQVRERALQKLALAASLAAALLLFALGWWVVRQTTDSANNSQVVHNPVTRYEKVEVAPRDRRPVEQRLQEYVAKIRKPTTPPEYVKTYHQAADNLFQEIKDAKTPESRRELVEVYVLLVREELPRRAEDLAHGDREETLRPLIDFLAHKESDARRLAERLPPEDAEPMKLLELAAKEGREKIDQILKSAA